MADRDLRIRVILGAVQKLTGPLAAVAGGAGKAGRALKALRAEEAALKKTQAELASARGLEQALSRTANALEEARRKAAALKVEIRAAGVEATDKMRRAHEKATAQVKQLSGAQAAQLAELRRSKGVIAAAGHDVSNLAAAEANLKNRLQATNTQLERQRTLLKNAGARDARMAKARDAGGELAGRGAAVGAAGAAIGVPILGQVNAAEQFESRMTDIAQKADLGRKAARGMGQELVAAGQRTNKTPEEMQAGIDTLAGLGMDPREAMKAVEPMARASTAYKAAMEDIAASSYAAVTNLKIPVEKVGQAIDIQAYAGKRGAVELKDMAQYLPSLSAAYEGLGQTGPRALAGIAAGLQITRKGAGDSASAATNLENILQKIYAPATIRKFADAGIDLRKEMDAAAKAGKDPLEAIAELTQKATKGDKTRIGDFFEDAQVQQGLRPLIANLQEYRDIRDKALAAEGVVSKDFVERMKDGAEVSRQFNVNAGALGLTIGASLAPPITATKAAIGGLMAKVTAWANENPKVATGVFTVVGAIAGLLVGFGALLLAIAALQVPFAMLANGLSILKGARVLGGIFPFVAKGVSIFGMALARAGAALLLNPMTWIILAIVVAVAALAAAAFLVYRNWGKITAWFANMWAGVKTTFGAGLAWVRGLWSNFSTSGANLIQGFIDGIRSKLGAVKDAIKGVASSAVGWFREKLGIRSPSRVFAALGDHTMAGLAIGLQRSQDGPLGRVRQVAAGMTAALAVGAGAQAAMAQPLALQRSQDGPLAGGQAALAQPLVGRLPGGPGPAQSVPPAPATIAIHVHPPPGMNEVELARLVAKEVARLQRADAARRLSSLRDPADES